jgi:uncharacterized membrane protein
MQHEWVLKRNCSLPPRQSLLAYGALGGVTLLIGLAFALSGLWMVLLFALIDIVALSLALFCYARHATDSEHIVLGATCLRIERTEADQVRVVELEPCWTRIGMPDRQRHLIALEAGGVKVEVGSFVGEEARLQAAEEIRSTLRTHSYLV